MCLLLLIILLVDWFRMCVCVYFIVNLLWLYQESFRISSTMDQMNIGAFLRNKFVDGFVFSLEARSNKLYSIVIVFDRSTNGPGRWFRIGSSQIAKLANCNFCPCKFNEWIMPPLFFKVAKNGFCYITYSHNSLSGTCITDFNTNAWAE